ncbi:hypothetical protein FBZ99_101822 [Rhizobium sp. ERR 1071]|uniref:hypothetical protein n=1 Tax=Rhizobium sp. ERR 1071 TaxID=2572677 RepID=UPI001199A31E|nr:hypothetical protein [Rhizobium sp. ERR1071]TWB20031.1 hypothetical protein FBZ99_101822 [Rhizobium sp. ERR1071]
MTVPYTAGTITLNNGSAVVTGVGTGWQTALIAGGIVYAEAANGNAMPILTVDSDTQITAATKWKGASGTYSYALVVDTAYDRQVLANATALAQILQGLQKPSISALSALTPAIDKLPYFTGGNTAALTGLTATGRDIIDSANVSEAQSALGISTFIKGLLDDADAVAARLTLKVTWETIINQAVSGVSVVDLTNLGTYELIKISGALDVSSNSAITAVFSSDNGASFGNVYGEMYTSAVGTTLANQYFASAPGANITPTADAGAGNGGAFEMIIFNFNKANRAKFTCRAQIIQSGQFLYAQYNGYQPTTAARNALRILCNAGTMSGSIKVEGIRG